MEEHTRKFKHIRAPRSSSDPWQKKSQPPRRSLTTKAEIDFCCNCPTPDKECKYGECQALREFKRSLVVAKE